MLGTIAAGETPIKGLLLSDDLRSGGVCFQAMGTEIYSNDFFSYIPFRVSDFTSDQAGILKQRL